MVSLYILFIEDRLCLCTKCLLKMCCVFVLSVYWRYSVSLYILFIEDRWCVCTFCLLKIDGVFVHSVY